MKNARHNYIPDEFGDFSSLCLFEKQTHTHTSSQLLYRKFSTQFDEETRDMFRRQKYARPMPFLAHGYLDGIMKHIE